MNTNSKLVLVALATALVAASPACSSSDDNGGGNAGGGGGGGGSIDTGNEICDNGVDDDGDEAVDCDDPNCLEVEACHIGCTDQVPACEGSTSATISQICMQGTCVPAGQVSDDGAIVRGDMQVFNQLAPALQGGLTARNKAYLVEVFHPENPDGSAASCDAIVEAGLSGRTIPGVNLVGSIGNKIQVPDTTVPTLVPGLPVPPEGKSWIFLTRFYSTSDQQGRPAGELFAIGCKANVVVPPGAYVEGDESHTLSLTMQPVCNPADADSCSGGKTCQVGALVCRDRRCGTECSGLDRETCREIDGEPTCLKQCDPESLPCTGDGERCDTTPGEQPACVPSAG